MWRLSVESPHSNIAGVYSEVAGKTIGGRSCFQRKGGAKLYFKTLRHGFWYCGPKLGGNAFLAKAQSTASTPDEIEEGAFGNDITSIQRLPPLDDGSLEACPRVIGVESIYNNLEGGYKRHKDYRGYPSYFNEEGGKFLWQSTFGKWVITDGPPGEDGCGMTSWPSTELDPSCLKSDEASTYEISWAAGPKDVMPGFTDPEFPPDTSSIGKPLALDVQWIRASVLNRDKEALVFAHGIEPNDLIQGALGDCWLIAAMASLAEYPEKIKKLFVTGEAVQQNGKYVVRLYHVGKREWQDVVIDDWIPCHQQEWWKKNARTYFARPTHTELWTALLEKAFAKFVGSYAALEGGFANWAWQAMTGCEEVEQFDLYDGTWTRRVVLLDNQRDSMNQGDMRELPYKSDGSTWTCDEFFEYLKSCDRKHNLMSPWIASWGGESERPDGLVAGHAYSLTSVVETEGLRLLQLRNPWGNATEWQGAWCDSSPDWDNYPHLAATLRDRTRPLMGELVDAECPDERGYHDGLFWMSFDDFCGAFDTFNLLPHSMLEGTVPEPPKGGHWAVDLLGKQLMATGLGMRSTEKLLKSKRAVCLHFSAHWCPPCRELTPILVESYAALQAEGVEIVFLSSDKDKTGFKHNFGEMAWLALPFKNKQTEAAASGTFGVSGLPALVVLDGSDGKLLTNTGHRDIVQGCDVASVVRSWFGEDPISSNDGDVEPATPHSDHESNPIDADVAEKLKTVFHQWDSSGDGLISSDELTRVLCHLNPDFTEERVQCLFEAVDTDGNGMIDYNEFVEWLCQDEEMMTLAKSAATAIPALLLLEVYGFPSQSFIPKYAGYWYHDPLPNNPHVFTRRLGGFASCLYWQDDWSHWRVGDRTCADPAGDMFGYGEWHFRVPGGSAQRYFGDYKADGLIFKWGAEDYGDDYIQPSPFDGENSGGVRMWESCDDEVPDFLTIGITSELKMDFLSQYEGAWTHHPLKNNKHVYMHGGSEHVLYWQDDWSHWRTGTIECADPEGDMWGSGSLHFRVPGGRTNRYEIYEIDGLTFVWSGAQAGDGLRGRELEFIGVLAKVNEALSVLFRAYDVDANGYITYDEMIGVDKLMCAHFGQDFDEEAKRKEFEASDLNEDRKVTLDEFLKFTHNEFDWESNSTPEDAVASILSMAETVRGVTAELRTDG